MPNNGTRWWYGCCSGETKKKKERKEKKSSPLQTSLQLQAVSFTREGGRRQSRFPNAWGVSMEQKKCCSRNHLRRWKKERSVICLDIVQRRERNGRRITSQQTFRQFSSRPPPWLFPRKERKKGQVFFPFFPLLIKNRWMTKKSLLRFWKQQSYHCLLPAPPFLSREMCEALWWCSYFSLHITKTRGPFLLLASPPHSFVPSFAFSALLSLLSFFSLFEFMAKGRGRPACLGREAGGWKWRAQQNTHGQRTACLEWNLNFIKHGLYYIVSAGPSRAPTFAPGQIVKICFEIGTLGEINRGSGGYRNNNNTLSLFKTGTVFPLFLNNAFIYRSFFPPFFLSLLWPDWSGGNPIFFCAVALSGSIFCDFISDWLEVTSFECRNVARNYDRGGRGRSNRKEEVERKNKKRLSD